VGQGVLGGDDATRALDVARLLADGLAASPDPPDPRDWSLCRGSAGIAVFLAEAAFAFGDDALADRAAAYLDAAVAAAVEARPSPSLYAGTVGVGWALQHLDGRLLDASGATGDVDDLVLRTLAARPLVADLTDGIVGLGAYLLARLPAPAAREGVNAVVAALAAAGDGATWPARPETLSAAELAPYPDGFLSLGIAHGQAGVVALLARLHGAGAAGAEALLRDAVTALRGFGRPGDDAVGRYPVIVPAGGEPGRGSRLGWCYGDPGVAVALAAAADALGDGELAAEAAATARAAAARPREGSYVVDAGLCHGAAGLLHVFGRLAPYEPSCAEAAHRWYEVLLGLLTDAPPYVTAVLDAERGHEPAAGYLEGAAGVGLALLTAAGATASAWDAVLLTESRGGGAT
jgi:hypothetical protein